jgi:hypothetical protein
MVAQIDHALRRMLAVGSARFVQGFSDDVYLHPEQVRMRGVTSFTEPHTISRTRLVAPSKAGGPLASSSKTTTALRELLTSEGTVIYRPGKVSTRRGGGPWVDVANTSPAADEKARRQLHGAWCLGLLGRLVVPPSVVTRDDSQGVRLHAAADAIRPRNSMPRVLSRRARWQREVPIDVWLRADDTVERISFQLDPPENGRAVWTVTEFWDFGTELTEDALAGGWEYPSH